MILTTAPLHMQELLRCVSRYSGYRSLVHTRVVSTKSAVPPMCNNMEETLRALRGHGRSLVSLLWRCAFALKGLTRTVSAGAK